MWTLSKILFWSCDTLFARWPVNGSGAQCLTSSVGLKWRAHQPLHASTMKSKYQGMKLSQWSKFFTGKSHTLLQCVRKCFVVSRAFYCLSQKKILLGAALLKRWTKLLCQKNFAKKTFTRKKMGQENIFLWWIMASKSDNGVNMFAHGKLRYADSCCLALF